MRRAERRRRQRYRTPCCGSPKPWKHALGCPVIELHLRELLMTKLYILLRDRAAIMGDQQGGRA